MILLSRRSALALVLIAFAALALVGYQSFVDDGDQDVAELEAQITGLNVTVRSLDTAIRQLRTVAPLAQLSEPCQSCGRFNPATRACEEDEALIVATGQCVPLDDLRDAAPPVSCASSVYKPPGAPISTPEITCIEREDTP